MIDLRSIAALAAISSVVLWRMASAADEEPVAAVESGVQHHMPILGAADKRFYSWEGGKRHGQEDKRKFYAYNKRHGDEVGPEEASEPEKRKFYAWAGKRGHLLEDNEAAPMDEADRLHEMKRKFYAWAGKRSGGPYEEEEKRKFYAYNKRHGDDASPIRDHMEEKRKFYAWAGRK